MNDDLKLFEKRLTRELSSFKEERTATVKPKTRPTPSVSPIKGIEVTLAVRKNTLVLNETFTTVIPTISREMAIMEAKRQAREAGWKTIAFMQDIRTIHRDEDRGQ